MNFHKSGLGFLCLATIPLLFATSAQARFLQVDPVGYGDNMNMYVYVANDPINAIDPNGKETFLVARRVGNIGLSGQVHLSVAVKNPETGAVTIISFGPDNGDLTRQVPGTDTFNDDLETFTSLDGQDQNFNDNGAITSISSDPAFDQAVLDSANAVSPGQEYDALPALDSSGSNGVNSNSAAGAVLDRAAASRGANVTPRLESIENSALGLNQRDRVEFEEERR